MTDTPDDKRHHLAPPPLPSPEPPPVPGAPLQFDTAEFGQPAGMGCSGCQRSIITEYYELNGATLCSACRAVAAGEKGTRLLRVLRAAVAGGAAAFAGGLLYFLVAYMFDSEIGLISIAVGFAVGVAVKWGSYGRGGAVYQAMAVALTYLAIVSSLMAVGMIQVIKGRSREVTSTTSLQPAGEDTGVAQRASSEPDRTLTATDQESADEPGRLVSLVMLTGVMLALPFLGGIQNIIGIIIIAVGVYEAWKINKRPAITGPHAVARSNGQAVS